MRLVRVAVPVPSLDALTYNLPDAVPDAPAGARVLVPLGNRVLTGVVIRSHQDLRDPGATDSGSPRSSDRGSEEPDIKDVIEVLDTAPFLPDDVLQLCEWVADYY